MRCPDLHPRGAVCEAWGVAAIPDTLRDLLDAGPLAHLVTLDPDGAPHASAVWVAREGDDLVVATLFDTPKLRNIRTDPRVSVSVQATTRNAAGLTEYAVLEGTATITEGGAPELLQRLARTYIAPDAVFPPMPDPPPGYLTRIAVRRVRGVGPWAPSPLND